MNIFKKFYCRTYQTFFKIALPILPYREPKMLKSVTEIASVIKSKGLKKPLIVTDKSIYNLGLTKELEESLTKNNLVYCVFSETVPNPTIKNIEDGLKLYTENSCDSIIAYGGGSSMDCAKIIGARSVKPKMPVSKMKGLLKICKKLPLFFAVPTTAGTGSETTLAAVITDDKTHHKYPINDFSLIPHYAVLDYSNTIGLPPHITSTTGMDALTHAVEAFIGRSTTPSTRRFAKEAVKLVYENLYSAYTDGTNKNARQNMLNAAYLAGLAFTKSYVGYVHAVAHSLGGAYGVPHGLANAVILPYFLDEYGSKIHKKLAALAKYAGIATKEDNIKVSAEKFITWTLALNKKMNIPEKIEGIKDEDIPHLAKKADKEGNPLYPVPVLMDAKELCKMYYKIKK